MYLYLYLANSQVPVPVPRYHRLYLTPTLLENSAYFGNGDSVDLNPWLGTIRQQTIIPMLTQGHTTLFSAWNGQSPTRPIRLDFGLS